jgi:hypothetical protein
MVTGDRGCDSAPLASAVCVPGTGLVNSWPTVDFSPRLASEKIGAAAALSDFAVTATPMLFGSSTEATGVVFW